MSTLLNFKPKRSPTQNAAIAFIVMLVCFVAFGVIPTQWFAHKFGYDPNLGQPLFVKWGASFYTPTDWVIWGWNLGDVEHLKSSVQTMLVLGCGSVILALFFAAVVSRVLSRYDGGMDDLHGSAHFAEREDVDLTGFLNSKDYVAQGVVVGSVILDRKKKVIHPHHRSFKQRYKPLYEPRRWATRFRKIPLRDKESGRPLFAVQKKVVKGIEVLRDGGNTHIFGFCPTRSGKGVGMVIPTLLTYRHSVMVNDPKGEAYALTSGFRKYAGQKIIKFMPACEDGTGACWNPLDEIRIFTLKDVADAQMIMAMACDPKGKGLDDYFDKAGYEFMTAVALHVRYKGQNGSLAGCAEFLGDPLWDSDKQMYTEMMQAIHDPEGKMGWKDSLGNPSKTHPMIANAAKTMLNKEDKDRSGVLSTAKSLLSLYLDPITAMNTSHSDFLVRDLMTGTEPVSLYYVVSSADMERMTPLTRLFYALFIRRNASDMEFEGGRTLKNYSHPLLMIIDEMPSLQKLPIIPEALGYIAGYGIRMMMLAQDITQIDDLYGDKQGIDSGSETRIVYAPNKETTAALLSRMTGETTVTEVTASNSHKNLGIDSGNVSLSVSKTARNLMTTGEILNMHDQDVVIFVRGKAPIYGRKAYFYEDKVLLARASMKPPIETDRLRVAPPPAEVVGDAPKPPSEADKWRASRQAMAERVESVTAPAAGSIEYTGPERREQGDVSAAPAPGLRSRYADQVKTITDEERRQIQTIVADVELVEKVVAVSAF